MGEKISAFLRGGFGLLLLLAAAVTITLLCGGQVQVDAIATTVVFLIGGAFGVALLTAYNKGRRDALRERGGQPSADSHPRAVTTEIRDPAGRK